MTAKLMSDYIRYKKYINAHRATLDHDIKSIYGVNYPIDDIDRLSMVLFDRDYRRLADAELRAH